MSKVFAVRGWERGESEVCSCEALVQASSAEEALRVASQAYPDYTFERVEEVEIPEEDGILYFFTGSICY